jgi:penicillin amidase
VEIAGQKTWQDFNSLTMRHPMATVPVLGGLLALNRGNLPWPGTAGTLNASYLIANDDYSFETIVGPSWRFLIDFANIDGALFVLPAGNSGNPMSPHFFDFNQMWLEGKYWNIPISKDRVLAKAVNTLVLNPVMSAGN